MPLAVKTREITEEPFEVLVGAEGTVWLYPMFGDPFIIAATNEEEKAKAETFISWMVMNGFIPYGIPLSQRAEVALFGGRVIRGCSWVSYADAPMPAPDEDGEIPTKFAAVVEISGQ